MRIAIAVLMAAWASHYGPGKMQGVIELRQAGKAWVSLPATLPDVDGYAAARDCAKFGDVVYLRPAGAQEWETFLVADCAMPAGTDGTLERMTADGREYEIDYPTAVRWGTVGAKCEIEVGIGYDRRLKP